MTFFTALIISYTLSGHEAKSIIWTESAVQCEAAMGEAMQLYKYMMKIGEELEMRCIGTGEVSAAPPPPPARPKQ